MKKYAKYVNKLLNSNFFTLMNYKFNNKKKSIIFFFIKLRLKYFNQK